MLRRGLFLLTFFSATCLAATVDITALQQDLPTGSQFALTVFDPKTGNMDVQQNQDLLLPPASTQKLVTALAASLYLPDNFRFETSAFMANNQLILQFGGDPTLTRSELRNLLSKLKQQGITQISGDIWLDDSIFAGYERAVGWPWDSLGVCYSAPSSAVSLEKNCVQGSLKLNAGSKQTQIYIPQHQPVTTSNNTQSLSKSEQKAQQCELELLTDANNHYALSGCVTYQARPFPLMFAVQNTRKYVADVIRQTLQQLGIAFTGKIHYGEPVPSKLRQNKKMFAQHLSAPRDELLEIMLKDSDNLISDNLMKIMGHHHSKQAGTFKNGANAIKAILLEKAGIDLQRAVFVDGSGLSRNNRMSAAQLAQVLNWIYQHPKTGIIDMLPVSGVDGTLKYRMGVRYKPVKGKLQAKSGSLYGSHNLAGVLAAQSGDKLVVQLVTNYFQSDDEIAEQKMDKNKMPIAKFERQLYESLVKQ